MSRLLTCASVLALLGAGCGEPDGGAQASPAPSASAGPRETPPIELGIQVNRVHDQDVSGDGAPAELELELDSFYFAPSFIKAAENQKLTLKLRNDGDGPHTFTSEPLGAEVELARGARKDMEVTLPGVGPIEFHCRFHADQGMRGAIYFVAGSEATPAPRVPARGGY